MYQPSKSVLLFHENLVVIKSEFRDYREQSNNDRPTLDINTSRRNRPEAKWPRAVRDTLIPRPFVRGCVAILILRYVARCKCL